MDQNLKNVYVTYVTSWTFDVLLFNSCNFIWSLISHCIKEMLYVNTCSKWKMKKRPRRYTFSTPSDVDVEESYIVFNAELKCFSNNF